MDLLHKQVEHKSFGRGSVVECDDSYVTVRFPLGEKRFVFPDAFGTHLLLTDEKIASKVEGVKEKTERKRRKREKEQEKIRALEYEKQQRRMEWERLMKNHRLSPVSQAVFWVDQEEAEKVFSEWQIFTSTTKSGVNKGKPNRLVRLHQNSAILITAREADIPEKERRILGLFMVNEKFIGKLGEDGYIPAHSRYKLRFSEEESQQLLFWNYYYNKRYPQNMTWNSGRHRYFDNLWMAQILKDVAVLKKDSPEQELVRDFQKHFAHMNRLEGELPTPNGALIQLKYSKK
ncbi:MAG: malate synthase [Firmicutes bacterium]|nr:malate synthase [Bacillota bacterium]